MLQSFPSRRRFPCLLAAVLLLGLAPALLQAGLLPGNLWPNPTLETDANSDGVPDYWHRGGSSAAIDLWTTSLSVSPTHALQLNDTSTADYGEWYSDKFDITGGTNYQLRYNLRYIVTNVGPMRVTVNFYDAANALLSSASYQFTGPHDFWEEMTQQFAAPSNAVWLNLSFTSGGGVDVTGQAWLDDISLAAVATSSSLVPYLENFPPLPNPLVMRDWKQTALDYHQLAFNPAVMGQSLPLLYEYSVVTAAGILRSGLRFAELCGASARQWRGAHRSRCGVGWHARRAGHGVAQRQRPRPAV